MASVDLSEYVPLLLHGALVTVQITALSLLLGSALGIGAGLARSSSSWALRLPAILYIEIFRSIPILLQLFFTYYALPLFFHIDISQYTAATLALSVYTGAYVAEVVRASIEAVPVGQTDGAKALGFGRCRTFWYIVTPQALRIALPPAVGVYISTLKDSSLASVIGYVELVSTGLAIREVHPASGSFSVILAVALIFFLMCGLLSMLGGFLERWLRIPVGQEKTALSIRLKFGRVE